MVSAFSKKTIRALIHFGIDFSVLIGSLMQVVTLVIVPICLMVFYVFFSGVRVDFHTMGFVGQYDLLAKSNFFIPGNLASAGFLAGMILVLTLAVAFYGVGFWAMHGRRNRFSVKAQAFVFVFHVYRSRYRRSFMRKLDKLLLCLPLRRTLCIYLPVGFVLIGSLFFLQPTTALPGFLDVVLMFLVLTVFFIDFCVVCRIKKGKVLSKRSNPLFALLLISHVLIGGTLISMIAVVYACVVFPWSGQVICYGLWGFLCVARFWVFCVVSSVCSRITALCLLDSLKARFCRTNLITS